MIKERKFLIDELVKKVYLNHKPLEWLMEISKDLHVLPVNRNASLTAGCIEEIQPMVFFLKKLIK